MNREEVLNTFLLANIPEIITQEEFNDVKKAIKQLQQENKQLKDKLIEINEVINGYMPNQYAMCKAFDEIEFIISKGVE